MGKCCKKDVYLLFITYKTVQVEKPISFPFLPASRLTTERILAQIERAV